MFHDSRSGMKQKVFKNLGKEYRYQAPSFVGSLKKNQQQADRSGRVHPETKRALRDWLIDIVYVLLILGFVTLALGVLYWPKFFYINTVTVSGTNTAEVLAVKKTTEDWLVSGNRFWPRRNLLLTPTKELGSLLLSVYPNIYRVKTIHRKYPRTLEIVVADKTESFAFQDSSGFHLIYNDGVLASTVSEAPAPVLQLLPIRTSAPITVPDIGKQFLDIRLSEKLVWLRENFLKATDETISAVELSTPDANLPLTGQEARLLIAARNGGAQDHPEFKVIYNTLDDLDHITAELKLVLHNLNHDRLSSLSYVDLRFLDKTFVCLKGTACDK